MKLGGALFVFSLLIAAAFVAGGDIRVDDESMSDQIDDLNLAADAAAATTAAAAPAATQPAAATTAGESFCQRVLDVVNQVRTSPKTFAARLGGYNNPNQWSAHSSCSDGDDPKCMFTRNDNVKFLTHEGVKGIQNAIDFLNKQASLPALSAAPGLCNAAADMVKDQGPSGEIGHVGPRGSSILSRVATHGKFHADISEIVQYGSFLGDGTDESGPFDIVAQLVVGDGDATKAHRAELVSPVWKEAGAEMGDHITYGKMSCILFTDGFSAQ